MKAIGDFLVPTGPDYGPFKHGCAGAVIHDLECPIATNVKAMTGKGSYPDNAGVSPHTISGLTEIAQLLDAGHAGAHIGGPGNMFLVGFEVTGYAAWTTDQWMADIRNLLNQARAVGNFWRAMGWAASDLKWGSIAELQAAARRYTAGQPAVSPRLWTHEDVSQAHISNTNHWDPGLGFPFRDFARWCLEYLIGAGAAGPGGKPNPALPVGTPIGGAQSEEDLMRSIFFTYPGDVIDADGNPAVVSRVFESDGAVFQHIGSMETLELRLAFLTAIGVKAQLVTDGRIGLADATSALQVATAGPVVDPFVFGYDATAGR